ncbi:MAG: pyruvate carboxyltransferase [Desulfatibacillaceae bacterium]|nr:pyruvate carboxyltransferase [Desulfatibacillaceae bacterium]
MAQLKYPKKVVIGDITVRDGFQHEEKFIPTDAKLWVAEKLIQAGVKHMEITNYGPPQLMPQFKDADELMKRLRNSKKVKGLIDDVVISNITIREKAAMRAIEARKEGVGPDRILFMVSTSESHHRTNSGISLAEYWKMCEDIIPKAHEVGLKVCGTVSTIWGCPIEGPTELKKALEFTKRWLDIGADDIEHADHDGSAPPDKVYEYFSMVLDALPNPDLHIAHFHMTRGWGLANVLAALQAGITHFEGTLGGIGGQPANFVDGVPVGGTGAYYYADPSITGLVSTEDMVVMMDEMEIDTGFDVDKLLEAGAMVERIVGRRLRSECVHTGRIPKGHTGRR